MSNHKKQPWYMHERWDGIANATRTEKFLYAMSAVAFVLAIGFFVAACFELASPYDPRQSAVVAEEEAESEADGTVRPIDPADLKAPDDYVAAVNRIVHDTLDKSRDEGVTGADLRLAVESAWWKQVCSDKHSLLGEPMIVRNEEDPRFKTFLSYYVTAVYDKKNLIASEKLSMYDESKLPVSC